MSADSMRPVAPPPVLLVAAAAAQLAVGRKKRPGRSVIRRVLGGGAALAGAGLIVAGIAQLAGAGTTIDPRVPEESTELVRDGIFEVTRNPVYLGDVLLLLGLAIGQGRVLAYLPVAAFAALIDQRQIPAEEAALAGLFGEEFDAYARRTPRWL